jgi:rhodanese-related sulfurtransferase
LTSYAQQELAAKKIRLLDAPAVEMEMRKGVNLIDARYEADYLAGHIAGAMNVPPDMKGTLRRERRMKNIDKDSEMVIYCESFACPYSGNLAHDLILDGYTHLSLFPGGWTEWLKNYAPASRRSASQP